MIQTMAYSSAVGRRHQSGVVLILAVVLLLLASVMLIFALRVGMFEQRASGNDLRARYVQQVADSAIAEGIEFVRAGAATFADPAAAHWLRCDASDTSFPCGAAPASQRANMRYYFDPAANDRNGDGVVDELDRRMLPIARQLGSVGAGFEVTYGVGVAVCWPVRANDTAPIECVDNPGSDNRAILAGMVGLASIPGEAARATASQVVGVYSAHGGLPDLPPFVAAGSVNTTGTLDLVAKQRNTEWPISVWNRGDLGGNGNFRTCQRHEYFYDSSGLAKGGVNYFPGTNFEVCDSTSGTSGCGCTAGSAMSSKDCLGIDVLAGSYGIPSCPEPNSRNEPIDTSNPDEFPCDLFQYIFTVKSWTDMTSPPDNFCETKLFADPVEFDAYPGINIELGRDVAYLDRNADWIIPGGAFAARYNGDPRVITCEQMYQKAYWGGIIWNRGGCEVKNNGQVGDPETPVLFITDGFTKINANGRVFGLMFLRETKCSEREASTDTCALTNAEADDGGTAGVQLNGGAAIYGALVVQGPGAVVNGTAHVISSPELLDMLNPSGMNPDYKSLPGSWNDRVRY